MANCKDCIHYGICTFHITGNENEKCLHYFPTADVIPRSEVAKEFTCFVGDPHKVDHCPYLDEIEKAKTEVAREIFESIEECIYLYYNKNDYTMPNIEEDIAELKKKYTEGKQ